MSKKLRFPDGFSEEWDRVGREIMLILDDSALPEGMYPTVLHHFELTLLLNRMGVLPKIPSEKIKNALKEFQEQQENDSK